MNRFFKPIKYLGILTVVIVISVLIVGGAERSFHNLYPRSFWSYTSLTLIN